MTKQTTPESREAAGRMLGGWVFIFIRAWLVMLALGGFANESGYDVALGYWAVLLGLLVLRMSLAGLSVNTLTFFRSERPASRVSPWTN